MLLSIGMMVKNEEKYLDECLNSLIPILNSLDSELIIVDTGSEDNTVEIAKKYTDKVYFHKWNNNFSEMRNIVLSYCIGEWFFCIDGDEVLENCDNVINFFKSLEYMKYNSASIYVRNFIDLTNKNNYSVVSSIRLFKKDKNFKFINAIHNQPLYKEPVKTLKTNCNHYGYISTDRELMEKKYTRTVTILKNELKKNPNDIYYLYQLSASYAMHKDYIEAVNYAEKAYECMKEKKVEIVNYLYVYAQLCLCYYNVHDYYKVEKYARESLKYDNNIIDIYYCLGASLMQLKKNKEAVDSFEMYLYLYENRYTKDNDVTIVDYTVGRINEVYFRLYLLNKEMKEYEMAKKYLLNIADDNFDIPANIVELCLTFKRYSDIKKYEEDLLLKNEINKIDNLHLYLENSKLKMDYDEANKLTRIFSPGKLTYNYLNKIRERYENEKTVDIKAISSFIEKIGLPSKASYYGDLLYYAIYGKSGLVSITKNLTFEKVNEFLQYLSAKCKDFNDVVYEHILRFGYADDFHSVKINKELCRYLILLNKLEKDKLQNIYMYYVELGIKYMKFVYSDFVLENECCEVVRTQEEKFFIYVNKAKNCETENKKACINYLRRALEVYSCMKDIVSYLLENQKTSNKNSEFQEYKIQVKSTIKGLIDNGDLKNAKALVNEYEKIVKNDVEIFSIKGVIAISEKNFIEAEKLLKQGLAIDNNNFDLFYNLGYLYSIQNRKVEALSAYIIAKLLCNENYNRKLIEKDILNLWGKKANSYNVIFCGKVEQCVNFEKVLKEWNIIGYITSEKNSKNDKKVIQIDNIKNYNYDFIMILDENNENKTLQELKNSGIKNNIYFYSNFKTSVIEGFDYRIRELLCKNDIEMIITGSSYAEVGIKAEKLNKNAINFAFSSQDLYYDYEVANYLLKYNNVKGSIRYAIMGLSYYCFDYDISQSIAKYRIHRYKDYIQDFHNNNDEIGINITKVFYEKNSGMKDYYELNKLKEKTIVKYKNEEQDYIAKKNSTMDYNLTRRENIDIFYKYLSLLKSKDIKPIIVICPTSKYYYQYFNDCYQKNKFYKILNNFKKDFNFQVIDYFNSNLFEDNDFWDYGHLNGKGAEKFTEILNSEINGL